MAEEKSQAAKLKEELFLDRKNGISTRGADEIASADAFCTGYKKFLDCAKTEREAVITAEQIAKDAGFTAFDCGKQYQPGDRVYTINRGKNIMLAVIGTDGCKDGVRLAIAHIDSPRLDLKPNPLYEANDLALFKTHYYGGIKKYQWTAVPLALHGTVVLKNGEKISVCVGEKDDEPCFCVTDLLPHLAQEQNAKTMAKGFTGEDLNVLIGSRPFKDDKESELVKLNIMNLLHEQYKITEADFLSAELELVPAYKARDIGFDRSMVGGYGHDDRICAYPALMAAIGCKTPRQTSITVLVDKEEIGSVGASGMQSHFFEDSVAEIINLLGEYSELKVRRALHNSRVLSSDVSAAFDPNYPSVMEKRNCAYFGKGLVLNKYTGARGKSGSNDANAEYIARLRRIFDDNDVSFQTSELGKVDQGGGGTIAYILANYGMNVIDSGVAVLNMHAPWEIISKVDLYEALYGYVAFLKEA